MEYFGRPDIQVTFSTNEEPIYTHRIILEHACQYPEKWLSVSPRLQLQQPSFQEQQPRENQNELLILPAKYICKEDISRQTFIDVFYYLYKKTVFGIPPVP